MIMEKSIIEDFKLFCDFCSHKKSFKKMDQVPLRVDKHAKNQILFAFICTDCKASNEKVTVGGQQIRVFTGRSRNADEKTVFDEEDSGNNI